MAKWGEGDPRWIVEERPDATNVNNWHWVEKNATPWSQERLKELLLNQTLEKGAVKIDFTEFKKIEGEASANNRKAKLIFFYEWSIDISFKANVAGSDLEYRGNLEILNLSDENGAHEIEISSHVTSPTGPHDNQIRHILNSDGLAFIRRQCESYVRELKEEFSKGIILPTEKSGGIKPQAVTTKGKTVIDKRSFQNDFVSGNAIQKEVTSSNVKTADFELVETFKVPPDRLFDILTQPELVRVWSPNSSVNACEGGEFSLLGGIISGRFTTLEKEKQISMKWRLKSYPEGHFAFVKLLLCDKGDSTDLKVVAENVPEMQVEDSKVGFTRYYFQHIGKAFSISLNIF